MLATYGVDVLDPSVSLRRVIVLARRLPPGSVQSDSSPLSWSTEAYLLAAVVDSLAALTHVTLRANGAKPPKPKPFPRPPFGQVSSSSTSSSTAAPAPAPAKTSWADFARAMMDGQ